MAVLSRADLDRLKRVPRKEPSPEVRRRLQEAMAELRRDSERIQERLVEAPRREARRFQAEMEALRRRMAAPFEAMIRAHKEMLRSWRADPYLTLLDPRSTLKRRRAAARRIAAKVPPIAFKQPTLRRAVRAWPADERENFLRKLFADALVEAGREARKPQPRIRLGRRWLTDRRGHLRVGVTPVKLRWESTVRWLLQRAYRKTARTLLVSGPVPPTTLAPLSTREREIWALLRAGTSTAKAAALLNVSATTVRVHKSRLRAKGLKT